MFLGTVCWRAAFVLMATVQFPVLPQAPYLRYDPSDPVALLAGLRTGSGGRGGPPKGRAVPDVPGFVDPLAPWQTS